MKINDFGELNYFKIGRFKHLKFEIPAGKNMTAWIECVYEETFLNTNNETLITAYHYCKLYRLWVTKKSKSVTGATSILYREDHPVVQKLEQQIETDYDFSHNCFGYAVLGKKYWLGLDEYNLNCLLSGDNYQEVKKAPKKEQHLVVYYQNQVPVHIAKYNAESRQYEHKIGYSRLHICQPTDNIREHYNYNSVKYYIKQL